MAVPFMRTSKTKKRMRHTHFKLHVTGLVTCSNCGALIPAHTVCPKCGFYQGENVLGLKAEEKAVETKKKSAKTKTEAAGSDEAAKASGKKAPAAKAAKVKKPVTSRKPTAKKQKVVSE